MHQKAHRNAKNTKHSQMQKLAEEIIGLESSPLYPYRTQNGYLPVIGEGSLDAKIMFIGEAPGLSEAQSGRPFVGRAGKFLDELLNSINLNREKVYITNIVKDRPPDNRDPRADEIKIYAPFLERQLTIIQPRIIATLGRFAMNYTLKLFKLPQHSQPIGSLHGKILIPPNPYAHYCVLPLYHPAAVFYNRGLEKAIHEDFELLKDFTQT